jgi:hypothetical protein
MKLLFTFNTKNTPRSGSAYIYLYVVKAQYIFWANKQAQYAISNTQIL